MNCAQCACCFQGHAVESELLFRSTKSADFRTRIDILFEISEFHLRTSSHGLSITQASDSDVQSVFSLLSIYRPERGGSSSWLKERILLVTLLRWSVAAHEVKANTAIPAFLPGRSAMKVKDIEL